MPSRVIKGEIVRSESLSRVSLEADLTFRNLLQAVDDYGRLDARPLVLAHELFPTRRIEPEVVMAWLHELEREGCLIFYEAEGRPYLYLPNWERHRANSKRASRSKYPEPQAKPSPDGTSRGDPRKPAEIHPSDACRMSGDEGRVTGDECSDASGAESVGPPAADPDPPEPDPPAAKPTATPALLPMDGAEGLDTIAINLANLLLDQIVAVDRKRKVPKTVTAGRPSWATTIRRMIDCDSREPPEIEAAIRWHFEHFGRPYALSIWSADALREKYDRLRDQAARVVQAERTSVQAQYDKGVADFLAEKERRAAGTS